jgi:LysM repeat protein
LFRSSARSKRTRQRAFKYAIIAANLVIIGGVAAFVVITDQSSVPKSNLSATPAAAAGEEESVATPLDTLSSSDVAVNVARTVGLTEATAVNNQADSIKLTTAIAQADSAVVTKPQVLGDLQKSAADIQTYVAQQGDTVSSVAAKFGVTSESIRWSNNLTGDTLRVGTSLVIPPVNGVVYIVAAGDTPEKIAEKYQTGAAQIIAFNDAEITGLKPGQRIVIPNGKKPATTSSYGSSYAGGSGSFAARYGFNGYDYGWCTWYVANKVNMPANWGNANTWDNSARRTEGWTVSSKPVPGAIAQTDGMSAWGHVAYVEEVSADGSMIKYSDMNGIARWGVVGYSGWVSARTYPNYIYR